MQNSSPYLHERLDAYRLAVEFYQYVKAIHTRLPRGVGPIGDLIDRESSEQWRAATSESDEPRPICQAGRQRSSAFSAPSVSGLRLARLLLMLGAEVST
jgi:hypothetical protein